MNPTRPLPRPLLPIPRAAPADTMSAHDSHMMNLRESGYNPKDDLTAAGNVKAN